MELTRRAVALDPKRPDDGRRSASVQAGRTTRRKVRREVVPFPEVVPFRDDSTWARGIAEPSTATATSRIQRSTTAPKNLAAEPYPAASGRIRRSDQPSHDPKALPDHVRGGVERLSGYSMADVRVHRNSAAPSRLGALAYTQGTDIFVAPGQEAHLPHEAWHVVQQKQGRVAANARMDRLPVNLDVGLEREAEVMGSRAARLGWVTRRAEGREALNDTAPPAPVIQGFFGLDPMLEWAVAGVIVATGLAYLFGYFDRVPMPYAESIRTIRPAEGPSGTRTNETIASPTLSVDQITAGIKVDELPTMNVTRAQEAAEQLCYQLRVAAMNSATCPVGRIDLELAQLLVRAVAVPRSTDDRLASGVLGPTQVENAVTSLVSMSDQEFRTIRRKLDSMDGVRAALLLKAIAARHARYRDQGESDQLAGIEEFGAMITEEDDPTRLLERASLRDVLKKDRGLQQRFVNTCGPTALQVMRGELDPAYAWRINLDEDPEIPLHVSNTAAQEQLEMLDVDEAPPMFIRNQFDVLRAKAIAVGGMIGAGLLQMIDSGGVDDEVAAQIGSFFGMDAETVSYLIEHGPLDAKGSSFAELHEMSKGLVDTAGYEVAANRTHKKGPEEDQLDDIDRTLIGGEPVPIGITFLGDENEADLDDPGHELLLVDIRGTGPQDYEYLMYDPTAGRSSWWKRSKMSGQITISGRKAVVTHSMV